MILTCLAASAAAPVLAERSPPHVTAVAFSPDGRRIVTGSQSGVKIHNSDDLALLGRIDSELESESLLMRGIENIV